MKLLSILLPVYNVEQYIRECLDSITSQITDDVEVILVDDGSTDNSGKICDEYASKEGRIIVHHTVNRGVSAARNLCLTLAKGKYIAWVDPDDYITEDYLKKVIEKIKEENEDILVFDYYIFMNEATITKCYGKDKNVLSSCEFLADIVDNVSMQSHLWHKICKAKLYTGIKFPENINCMEDFAILHKVVEKADNVYYLDRPLYYYRFRGNSLVNSFDLTKLYNCYLIAEDRYNYLVGKYAANGKATCLIMALSFCMQYVKSDESSKKKFENKLKSNIGFVLLNNNVCLKIKIKFLCLYFNLLYPAIMFNNYFKRLFK